MSRNTLIALITSLLLHLILVLAFNPKLISMGEPPSTSSPFSVTLNTAPKHPAAEPPPMESQPAPPPPVIKKQAKPVPSIQKTPVKTVTAPAVIDKTLATSPPPPQAIAPREAAPEATDMMALVNANRARKMANEGYSAKDYADSQPQQRALTDDEIREAKIKRNLQEGQRGLFRVLGKNSSSATLGFRGWSNDLNNSHIEIIAVEAGFDRDIDRAIVRKMIEIIRKYYPGDFTWFSTRLDKTVTLSARKEDNAGLEDFLLHEGISGIGTGN